MIIFLWHSIPKFIDIIGKIMQIIEYNINTHIRTGIGKMLTQHFGAEKWVENVVL